jgi:hypothetical protein
MTKEAPLLVERRLDFIEHRASVFLLTKWQIFGH